MKVKAKTKIRIKDLTPCLHKKIKANCLSHPYLSYIPALTAHFICLFIMNYLPPYFFLLLALSSLKNRIIYFCQLSHKIRQIFYKSFKNLGIILTVQYSVVSSPQHSRKKQPKCYTVLGWG